ncbi:MAG: FkbM family methyltransferase [Rhodomicrobium sp.]
MTAILNSFRWLGEHVPGARALHAGCREPYYRCLEMLFPHGVQTSLAHGCQVRLHPRFLGMMPYRYEPEVSGILDSYLHPGMTVLDIGAHVGLHTLRFGQRVGADGCVLAVEPSPANAAQLRKHLEWNGLGNTTVIESAIGESRGQTEFVFRPDAMDPGGFANTLAYDVGGSRTQVRVTTIDDLCRELVPDVIKIDVEGAELLAIRGGEKTLRAHAPVLLVAVHPRLMPALGTSPEELVRHMDRLGYEGRHLDGRPVDVPDFEEIVFEKRRVARNLTKLTAATAQ